MTKERLCDALTERDYAAIGRAMVTFSFVEHELARAASGILGKKSGARMDQATSQRIVKKSVEHPLAKRAAFFVEVYRDKYGDDDWITKTEATLRYVTKTRNHCAHGIWTKASDGKLIVEYFSRDAVKEGKPSEILGFSVRDLRVVSEMNIDIAAMLHDKFAPLPDLPRD